MNKRHDPKGRFAQKGEPSEQPTEVINNPMMDDPELSTGDDDNHDNHETGLQPTNGVFGRIEEEFRSRLGEVAMKRIELLNKAVTIEEQTNQFIESQFIPRAVQRLESFKTMAKQQGLAGGDDEKS